MRDLLVVVTATALVCAMLLAVPPRTPPRLHDEVRRRAGSGPPHSVLAGGEAVRWWAAAGLAVVVAVLGVRGVHLALGGVLGASVLAATRLVEGGRRERRALERREQVVLACEVLLGELKAGQPHQRALERTAESWDGLRPVATAGHLGADVPEALRRAGASPGADGLMRIAAAWQLSADSGAGLAYAVEQVLTTVRTEQTLVRRVQAELASARATARLVAVLPVVVLFAASGMGADPWAFLLASPAGVGCLAAGLGCAFTGLFWIDRIARRAIEG